MEINRKRKSERKVRNLFIAIFSMVIGLSCVATSFYLLTMKNDIQEENIRLASNGLQECKTNAARRGFQAVENENEVYFFSRGADPRFIYSLMFNMQDVINSCNIMHLESACIGDSCDVPGVISESMSGLPFYFVLSNEYLNIEE